MLYILFSYFLRKLKPLSLYDGICLLAHIPVITYMTLLFYMFTYTGNNFIYRLLLIWLLLLIYLHIPISDLQNNILTFLLGYFIIDPVIYWVIYVL